MNLNSTDDADAGPDEGSDDVPEMPAPSPLDEELDERRFINETSEGLRSSQPDGYLRRTAPEPVDETPIAVDAVVIRQPNGPPQPRGGYVQLRILLAGQETRLRILDCIERGLSIRGTAEALSISKSQVSSNLAKIYEIAATAQVMLLNEWQARVMVRLERAQEEAWLAWEASQRPCVTVKQVLDKDGNKRILRELKSSAGDPRMLEQYQKAWERIAVVAGVWKTTQVNTQINVGAAPADPNGPTDDIRRELAQTFMKQVERMKNSPSAEEMAQKRPVEAELRSSMPAPEGDERVQRAIEESVAEVQAEGKGTPSWRNPGIPIVPGKEGGPAPNRKNRAAEVLLAESDAAAEPGQEGAQGDERSDLG